jgi:hypothetical protein
MFDSNFVKKNGQEKNASTDNLFGVTTISQPNLKTYDSAFHWQIEKPTKNWANGFTTPKDKK